MPLVLFQTLGAMLFLTAYETERDLSRKFTYGVGFVVFACVCLLVDCWIVALHMFMANIRF